MNSSPSETQDDFLKKMQQQFDFGPYPRYPIEQAPVRNSNQLFIHDLATSYYLQYGKPITSSGKLILDAGCGTGYKALVLAIANPEAEVIGIDISPKSIELAQQRLNYHGYGERVKFYNLAIEDLPQLGLKFDYINCDEVLYFFDNIAEGLSALKTVLEPTGIIRANLHSFLQRGLYYNAQELFLDVMGLGDEDAAEMAMPIVVETMKVIKSNVVLKQQTWKSFYEDDNDEEGKEQILANYLLKGDRGYRIRELFAALNEASLAFLSMVDWRSWNVMDLFQDPNDLPAYLAMGLADSSPETLLTMYELLNPVHRLLDFWCCHPNGEGTTKSIPVANWELADWTTAQVTLHPQLKTDDVREAILAAISQHKSLVLSNFLSHPTLKPVAIDSSVAALLLQLWGGPKTFTALVNFWQQTHPINLITLEPTTPGSAAQQVATALSKLEVFLYVLPELIP
jgi:ubiquinone/menaquinone biosynthesis C-methylase UbiE